LARKKVGKMPALPGVTHAVGADPSRAADLSEAELTEITPLLCRSGAGALAWQQLRNTPLAGLPAALELHEVYRRQRLSALLHEREIAGVVSLLRAEGIEAVLVKGWAIARRYPDPALRPYGDIDLCVRPDRHAKAARVLERIASIDGPFVDLHCGFTRIGQTKNVQSPRSKVQSLLGADRLWTLDFGLWTKHDDNWDELFARSRVVECAGKPVRVLSDEDHLRILCLHLLRSGAHRPPWLCDVALLLEQVQSPTSKVQSRTDRVAVTESSRGLSARRDAPGSVRINTPDPEEVKEDFGDRTLDFGPWTLDSGFDWDACLGRNPVDANWVGVAVRLAHELLGAEIRQTPFADTKLPRWLAPAVLAQWGGKRVQSPTSKVQSLPEVNRHWTLDIGHWTKPGHWTLDVGLWTNLYQRWDNPIRSTAAVGGRFDERSRLPYRLAEAAMRLPELPARLRDK
jgi:hypothetical protein